MKTENAVLLTIQTLIGPSQGFPVKRGNCFSVKTDEEKRYQIVNFNAENWEEMLRRGLELPVKILPISEHHAVIHDKRIPDDWYDSDYCEICCPQTLLPENQKLSYNRREARGEIRQIKRDGATMSIISIPMYSTQYPLFIKDSNL